MTNSGCLTEDVLKYLDGQIQLQGGFIGVRLKEDTVKRLEQEFRGQKVDARIFFLVAVDITGHHVLIVPEERADAKTFSSQQALWDYVGKIKIEETENAEILRWLGSPVSAAVKTWVPNPSGPLCLHCYSAVKSK